MILNGSFARFSDWFPTKQKFDGFLNYVETAWGTGNSIAAFAPSKKGDAEFQQWWGRFERLGGSPSAVINLMRMNSGINIENILPSISVPTLVLHRTEDPTVSIQAGRYLAAHIPGAKLVELDGPDHVYYIGDNAMQIADLVADFAARPGTEAQSTTASRRMLATILFTDIVDSTSRACELGDKAWRELLEAHDATVRREVARWLAYWGGGTDGIGCTRHRHSSRRSHYGHGECERCRHIPDCKRPRRRLRYRVRRRRRALLKGNRGKVAIVQS